MRLPLDVTSRFEQNVSDLMKPFFAATFAAYRQDDRPIMGLHSPANEVIDSILKMQTDNVTFPHGLGPGISEPTLLNLADAAMRNTSYRVGAVLQTRVADGAAKLYDLDATIGDAYDLIKCGVADALETALFEPEFSWPLGPVPNKTRTLLNLRCIGYPQLFEDLPLPPDPAYGRTRLAWKRALGFAKFELQAPPVNYEAQYELNAAIEQVAGRDTMVGVRNSMGYKRLLLDVRVVHKLGLDGDAAAAQCAQYVSNGANIPPAILIGHALHDLAEKQPDRVAQGTPLSPVEVGALMTTAIKDLSRTFSRQL